MLQIWLRVQERSFKILGRAVSMHDFRIFIFEKGNSRRLHVTFFNFWQQPKVISSISVKAYTTKNDVSLCRMQQTAIPDKRHHAPLKAPIVTLMTVASLLFPWPCDSVFTRMCHLRSVVTRRVESYESNRK